MDTRLRYISISHHTAPVARRERFHLSDTAKQEVAKALQMAFPDLRSLLVLVTCNRTELYFESSKTPAAGIRDFLLQRTTGTVNTEDVADFRGSDRTEDTVLHLLKVSAGLESSVMGDAEIIHQIRKAYHYSLETGMQGSLLERCMQTLFKTHKRVSNETGFRDGTTSTAYKALKLLGETDEIIDKYLQHSSQQIQANTLDTVVNRQGNGVIRLTKFFVLDKIGKVVDTVFPGEDYDFVFEYQLSEGVFGRSVNIALAWRDALQVRLVRLSSDDQNVTFDLTDAPSVGYFRCRIERLPFASGEYLLSVTVVVNNEVADYIYEAAVIQIHAGDYYRRGAIAQKGPIFIPHSWQLLDE